MNKHLNDIMRTGQALWCTPVIPSFIRQRQVDF